MKKTTKKKIVVSAVSIFILYLLAETIACLYEMINVYIPILQENYVTFEGMYTFCLIGCFFDRSVCDRTQPRYLVLR